MKLGNAALKGFLLLLFVLLLPTQANALVCKDVFVSKLTAADIQKAVESYILTELDPKAAQWKREKFDNKHADKTGFTHEDPLACRFCKGATEWIFHHLRSVDSKIDENFRVAVFNVPIANSKLLHFFIYSPKFNLLIDATFRQFMTDLPPEKFAKLPRYFMGTPEAFYRLLEENGYAHLTNAYQSAKKLTYYDYWLGYQ